jgi:hypothetical protein
LPEEPDNRYGAFRPEALADLSVHTDLPRVAEGEHACVIFV